MFIDQIGNKVILEKVPEIIISLVPSQTELLYHLGLGDRVIGITKFCIHPDEWFTTKERVGGPKKLDLEKIKALQPDLIIGNKEENIKEEIEALMEIAPVWLSDIFNLEESLVMISEIAKMCGKSEEGERIVEEIETNFASLTPFHSPAKVLYMIWQKPYMAVASNTFIDHVLTEHLGLVNAIGKEERYPEINPEELQDVDYVFLSTEPYPFQEKHIPEFQKLFPEAKILVVDGEYFTWYGSRLIGTPSYLESVKERM